MLVPTQQQDKRRTWKALQTHCKNGHEFNTENTYIQPKYRKRLCRICETDRKRSKYLENLEDNRQRGAQNMRNWRKANPERYKIGYTQERRDKRDWMNSFKTKCSQCPETDVACLDFHHIDPSTKEVALAVAYNSWSRNRIKAEIDKCIVLCANCHRKLHYNERNQNV